MTPFFDTRPGRRFFSRPYRPAAPCGVALLIGVLQVTNAAADDAAPKDNAEAAAAETTDLGKITVHTRNRLEPLQDVPVSVSVVTGSELERLDAYDITAIVKRVGDLQWNIGNQRTSSLALRGFGKQGQTEAQDPSVGVVVDGINYAYNALISS
jgi:iron complex outermembrane recepter protein